MNVEFSDVLRLVLDWGWVFLPILLFVVWKTLWLHYVQLKHDLYLNWITLEIKMPQVVEKTPKAMEQVFTGLYAMKIGFNFMERFFKGMHQPEMSLEIASINGGIHFFVRTPDMYKSLVVSQFLAQYADADIEEVEDYTLNLPAIIPNDKYDLWGTEFKLTREDAYPIKTYKSFKEENPLGLEGKNQFHDPMSSLMEVLSGIKEGEQVWVHYIIRPADDKWQKSGRNLIDKILGKKKKSSDNILEEVFHFFADMVGILFGKVPEDKSQNKEEEKKDKRLSPGETDTVKAIEESISKHGFHTKIRMIYLAERDVFSKANVYAIMGTFSQFSSFNLNGLKLDKKTAPMVSYFFKNKRNYLRKRKLYRNARRKRHFNDFILNTEELATVYHIPSIVVETPLLPKVETKKVQPPSGLPTV